MGIGFGRWLGRDNLVGVNSLLRAIRVRGNFSQFSPQFVLSRGLQMLKRLAVLTALAFGSVTTIAHADTINGFFSATGTDSFTSSTITFTPGSSQIAGGIAGTFATYLTDGNQITFLDRKS